MTLNPIRACRATDLRPFPPAHKIDARCAACDLTCWLLLWVVVRAAVPLGLPVEFRLERLKGFPTPAACMAIILWHSLFSIALAGQRNGR